MSNINCKWYTPCKYSNWSTISEGETTRGWPVLIQQKQCTICGKIRLRRVTCFN